MFTHLKDCIAGKAPVGKLRSSHWPAVRRAFLEKNPQCAVCGGKKSLQVHHIKPFHLHPNLELEESNLITLCESRGRRCHLIFGHLGSYRSFNSNVIDDAQFWFSKIANRPRP